MSSHYITIPDEDFGWLAATLYAHAQLGTFAGLAAAILEAAGAQKTGDASA